MRNCEILRTLLAEANGLMNQIAPRPSRDRATMTG